MPLIIHRKDPSGLSKPDVYNVEPKTNVIDWLIEQFGAQDNLCGELACSFVLNGKVIFNTDDDKQDESLIDFELGDIDQLVIINRPGFTSAVYLVVAIVAVAVAVLAMNMIPELPGGEGQSNSSPNNRLNAAQNEFRPGLAIPECFGSGVSYPDFIQPSFYFYENNLKKQIELMCISVGEVDISEVRIGETNITEIPESSATVYLPGSLPPSEFLKIHQPASTVDGQVLVAPDDQSLVQNSIDMSISVGASTADVTFTSSPTLIDDLSLSAGGYLYLRGEGLSVYPSVYGQSASVSPPNNICPAGTQALRNGTVIHRTNNIVSGEIEELDFNLLTAKIDGVSVTLSEAETDPNVANGSFKISSINKTSNTVTIETTSVSAGVYVGTVGRGIQSGELDYWIGWFNVPGNQIEEVWINWQAQRGIRTAKGKSLTIDLFFQIESIVNDVPTGNIWSQTVSITENTTEAQFRTSTFEPANFPGMTRSGYRVRARRLTNVIDAEGKASEEIKLERFESVTPYSNPSFGNVTTLLVQRKATLFSPDQAGKKISVDYIRNLPTYNVETGVYDEGVLTATKSFADAAAYTLIAAGNETAETVNLQELYAIDSGLSDSQLGEFTFTFDDANLSKGERVEVICNAARVACFHDGRQWRFSRDEAKPVRSALFNRRNVIENNATQSWRTQRDDDSDSVRISYVDPKTNSEAFIERKFNILTGEIISGEVGNTPKDIKLAGCRNEFQAINRAELEIRRIAYQRRSVKETTYREALELELLDRVGWVDINDIDTFDGEILSVNGNVFDTTERFNPEPGQSYVVFVTDNEGYSSNTVECLPRHDTDFGFIANGISGAYVANGLEQISSRYFIANADDLVASNFTLKSRTPRSDGSVEIELIEYRPEMFEKDASLPPSSAPIVPSGLVAINVEQESIDSVATITISEDGLMTIGENNVLWYSGGATSGIGGSFEYKLDVNSGSVSGIIGAWVDINSASWSVSKSGISSGVSEADITLSIRQIDFQDNFASNNIEMMAIVASPVELPASIICNSTGSASYAAARIDFESDGTWLTSCGSSGSYTTVASLIGKKYEIMASNLVGDAVEGPEFNVWHNLGGSGVEWILSTSSSVSCTFDVEVREIADTLNADTVSVNLSADVS